MNQEKKDLFSLTSNFSDKIFLNAYNDSDLSILLSNTWTLELRNIVSGAKNIAFLWRDQLSEVPKLPTFIYDSLILNHSEEYLGRLVMQSNMYEDHLRNQEKLKVATLKLESSYGANYLMEESIKHQCLSRWFIQKTSEEQQLKSIESINSPHIIDKEVPQINTYSRILKYNLESLALLIRSSELLLATFWSRKYDFKHDVISSEPIPSSFNLVCGDLGYNIGRYGVLDKSLEYGLPTTAFVNYVGSLFSFLRLKWGLKRFLFVNIDAKDEFKSKCLYPNDLRMIWNGSEGVYHLDIDFRDSLSRDLISIGTDKNTFSITAPKEFLVSSQNDVNSVKLRTNKSKKSPWTKITSDIITNFDPEYILVCTNIFDLAAFKQSGYDLDLSLFHSLDEICQAKACPLQNVFYGISGESHRRADAIQFMKRIMFKNEEEC